MEYAMVIMLLTAVLASEEFTRYLSNEEIYDYLKEVNDNYPNISLLYSIGTSGKGEELWVLMLSLAENYDLGVPNVKFVGNIHGNEPIGRDLIVYYIRVLLYGYLENDEDIVHLLQSTKIHFLPIANPDGFSVAMEGECTIGRGRKNSNNVDLNRDFLPVFSVTEEELYMHRERETTAIMDWMKEIPFVLSVSIHSGSLVVVYPYDELTPGRSSQYYKFCSAATDVDDVFRHLAKVYVGNSKGAMLDTCPGGSHFDNGIINGASWYSARGTMGDYNYKYHGCLELTVEVSCCKYPHPSKLNDIIDNHIPAMFAVTREAHQGIKGVVTCGGLHAVSTIRVEGHDLSFQTTENGEYWKILLPGRYFLEVSSPNCESEIVLAEIPRRIPGRYPEPVILDINLKKIIPHNYNDEISFAAASEERFNMSDLDTFYDTSVSTEGKSFNNFSERADYLPPRMESSVSLSASQATPSVFVFGLCWIIGLNWT